MKKEYWNIVLTAALVLGVLYTAFTFLGYVFYGNAIVGWMVSLASFGSILWSLVYYGKRAAVLKDVDGVGFTFGQAFGFSIVVLLLSGVIVGIGQWFLQNVVDPEFYDQLYKQTLENTIKMMGSSANDVQIEAARQTQELMRQPLAVVFSAVLSMGLMGGLVGLAASAIIKRKPTI